MCGIAGYIGSEQAAPILLSGLSKLEYWGYGLAGLAVQGAKVRGQIGDVRCGELILKLGTLPKTEPYFTASLAIVPQQLFGYDASVSKGLDVDKPRNLAKSVTVE